MKNNNAGFSLVELMVVVAIIGILATIAVPNFTRFQAKAKQSAAKTELTGIYTAERAFFVEYSSYTAGMNQIGYSPDGIELSTGSIRPGVARVYSVGFSDAAEVCTGGGDTECSGFAGVGVTSSAQRRYPANASGAEVNDAAGTVDKGQGGNFLADARGAPRAAGVLDVWTINDAKALANPSNGI